MREDSVSIRPLVLEDAHTSVLWRNNPAIWKTTISAPNREIKIEDELNWMKKILSETDSKRFAIVVEGNYIGNVQLTNIENNESYFGVFIGDQAYWGKGIGTIATKKILEFAFNELNLKRIKLRVKKDNSNAFHIYQKLGFETIREEEGIIFMQLMNNAFKGSVN